VRGDFLIELLTFEAAPHTPVMHMDVIEATIAQFRRNYLPVREPDQSD